MKKIVFIIITLSSINLSAQLRKKSNSVEYGATVGYNYQGSSFGELSFVRARFPKGSTIELAYSNWQLGTEFSFNKNDFVLGPKLSYEFILLVFNARANLTCYTNLKNTDLRFTPEIGISRFGLPSLYYGYNIPLQKNEFNCISRHRVSIVFNLIPYIWKGD